MDPKPLAQDAANRRVYHDVRVDREYTSQYLNRCEALTLLKYQPAFAGRDVLDLGVGTGRTALYLSLLARRYVGIDYSPVMVERAKANLPGVPILLGDIRDLSTFAARSFDMVFGSNNVVDAVSHDDRAKALSEAHRVLRNQGVLMFTSHNRLYRYARRGPTLDRSRNPVTQVKHVVRWFRKIANHRRLQHLCRFEGDFALLTDNGHDFACLHYYIDQFVQRERLGAIGFRVIDVLNHLGQSISETDPAASSPWLMYVASRESGDLGAIDTSAGLSIGGPELSA